MTHLSDELLQEYIDKVLNESENLSTEEHLSNCLICNNRKKEFVALSELFVRSAIRQPSDDFNSKVMSRVAALNFSPAPKSESSIFFHIPYLFAAALAVLVIVSIAMPGLEIESGLTVKKEVQGISKSKEIANQYLSKLTDIADPIANIYSFNFLNDLGNSSIAGMILVFMGSIFLYQLFELFHDKWQQRKWITHMIV